MYFYQRETQKNHLKAYGVAYWVLNQGAEVEWLLNYRGGSYLIKYHEKIEDECVIRGVTSQVITDVQASSIKQQILQPDINMDIIELQKAPKIAVYSPKNKQPWDDAVTLALTYAEIPYDVVYDHEVISGMLPTYDWLHLHHEDFTGQYGKFFASFRGAQWYIQQQALYENEAAKLGFKKVSVMEKAVVLTIKNFVADGGFLFAMCSATDSYDIALSGMNVDFVDKMYDGDALDANVQSKLDFSKTLAFKDFKIELNPMVYEYSNIDINPMEIGNWDNDYFTLFEYSAKYDPVPTMLTQNHVNVVRGFLGQTTMFRKELIKKSVYILGERAGTNQVKYIHGKFGRGTFTFYAGHDPEDYQHAVGDPPTDLELFKSSPGYRLILNNILFPAAKKKKQKT